VIGIDTLEYRDVAKTIDHSLLRPELDLDTVREGVELALRYDVASATVRPADVAWSAELVGGSDVLISTVVGFPHGSPTTATKAAETEELVAAGADEVDMVLNIARLISGDDSYVERDIGAVVEAAQGRLVKVIFENAYLDDAQKIRACQLTAAAGAGFVKTSTGFAASGATIDDLKLMREHSPDHVQVKAAGGVRTLDALLEVMNVGVTRIGATATEAILEDFGRRRVAPPRSRPPARRAGPARSRPAPRRTHGAPPRGAAARAASRRSRRRRRR
jgi:deoxyribose-phosphate aldolase